MITVATPEQILFVAENMREDDWREVVADSRLATAQEIAAACKALPCVVYAALADGVPVAVGGVARNEPGVAQAWLFGTRQIGRCKIEIAHLVRRLTRHAWQDGLEVQARSAAFHTRAHRWLNSMGFRKASVLGGYGLGGEDFVVFSMRGE